MLILDEISKVASSSTLNIYKERLEKLESLDTDYAKAKDLISYIVKRIEEGNCVVAKNLEMNPVIKRFGLLTNGPGEQTAGVFKKTIRHLPLADMIFQIEQWGQQKQAVELTAAQIRLSDFEKGKIRFGITPYAEKQTDAMLGRCSKWSVTVLGATEQHALGRVAFNSDPVRECVVTMVVENYKILIQCSYCNETKETGLPCGHAVCLVDAIVRTRPGVKGWSVYDVRLYDLVWHTTTWVNQLNISYSPMVKFDTSSFEITTLLPWR